MIKLVAFDWNGTLFADTQASFESGNLCLRHFGHKPVTMHRYRETFAVPISDFWLANGGTKADLVSRESNNNQLFNSFYEPRAKKVRTRSGSRKLLHWLDAHAIDSVIYSNHTVSGIEFQLQRLKIKDLIKKTLARTVADGSSHIHRRSKDQKLKAYVKRSGFKPREVLTIGDTCEEIEHGQKFGYHTVGITGGYNSASRLKASKPDFLIHSMVDLEKIIAKINRRK